MFRLARLPKAQTVAHSLSPDPHLAQTNALRFFATKPGSKGKSVKIFVPTVLIVGSGAAAFAVNYRLNEPFRKSVQKKVPATAGSLKFLEHKYYTPKTQFKVPSLYLICALYRDECSRLGQSGLTRNQAVELARRGNPYCAIGLIRRQGDMYIPWGIEFINKHVFTEDFYNYRHPIVKANPDVVVDLSEVVMLFERLLIVRGFQESTFRLHLQLQKPQSTASQVESDLRHLKQFSLEGSTVFDDSLEKLLSLSSLSKPMYTKQESVQQTEKSITEDDPSLRASSGMDWSLVAKASVIGLASLLVWIIL